MLFLALAILGPSITPYEPTQFHPRDRFQPPNATYWLGTDNFGRDVFSRVIAGARSILVLAGTATLFGLVLGTIVGIVSGYYGGWFDEVVMRVLDGFMGIPTMLMALLVISMIGSSTLNLILAIGVIYTPMIARVMRSATLQEKVQEYVSAAQVRGESTISILGREIFPNIVGLAFVEGPIRFGYAILLAASLGFLGLGVQPPTPDWGLMVNEGRNFLPIAPWITLSAAVAISLLIIGVSLLGDGIQQRMGITRD